MASKSDETEQNSTSHRAMAFPNLVPSISEVSQSYGTAVELHTYSTACLPDRWRNHRRHTARQGCEQQLNRRTVPSLALLSFGTPVETGTIATALLPCRQLRCGKRRPACQELEWLIVKSRAVLSFGTSVATGTLCTSNLPRGQHCCGIHCRTHQTTKTECCEPGEPN